MKRKYVIGCICMLLSFITFSQASQATLQGKVTDAKTGEELIGAYVKLFRKGVQQAVATSDFEGNYSIVTEPGTYDVQVSYVGCYTQLIKAVILNGGRITSLDTQMEANQGELDKVIVKEYKVPLVQHDNTTSAYITTSAQIAKMPTRNLSAMVGLSSGVTVNRDGDVIVKGARKEGSVYVLDGVRVKSSEGLPPAKEIDAAMEKGQKRETTNNTFHNLLEAALDIQAGRVTASENSDFKQWKFWQDNKRNEGIEIYQKTWGFQHFNRYPVLIVNEQGFPIPNCSVTLETKNRKTSWVARTDNLGRAELWSYLFEAEDTPTDIFINVTHQGVTHSVKARKDTEKGTRIVLNTACEKVTKTDVCFIIDATSSMGDEISYLHADLKDVVKRVQQSNPALSLHLSTVFYRDKGDDYLTEAFDFSDDVTALMSFWNKYGVSGGGGDYEEAVEEGLAKAIDLKWRDDAQAKIAFLLLDAPPHQNVDIIQRIKDLTAAYAKKGIKIIPIAASGIDKNTEYLMRFMALATNGTYTYLTDDSGVGESHIEATVADVSVEFLNNLLTRLINQNVISSTCEQNKIATIQKIENQQSNAVIKLDAKVFPIPAQEHITIELSEDVDNIAIYTLDGKMVQTIGAKHKGQYQIPLALATGTYFLQILKENVMFGQKFIVLNMI